MRLGCIADDFTGATDLANNLVRAGMRAVQTIGVPEGAPPADADAVVVALKSRTAPADAAVAQSLAALAWLRRHGAEQIYFKYCSTFDSTPAGNIGPVAEALMSALGASFTIATPAFPDNGRTVFKGHLFVGDTLLNESGMRDHPLTPMTDANLVRVLQRQCHGKVGLIDYRAVAESADAIDRRMRELQSAGVSIVIVDALSNDDLVRLGQAVRGLALVTGGSGVAIGLPQNWGYVAGDRASILPPPHGRRAIVSGSCSSATNRQVRSHIDAGRPALGIDPMRLVDGEDVVSEALAWAAKHHGAGPVLVYTTAAPEDVKAVQGRLGASQVGAMVESALAQVARGLVEQGVRQLLVAGGETSGACVHALGIETLRIGPQIDPGVPWCHAVSDLARDGMHLALKSGNFGSDDFFAKAFALLD